jgi:hypothetical protein
MVKTTARPQVDAGMKHDKARADRGSIRHGPSGMSQEGLHQDRGVRAQANRWDSASQCWW